MSTSDYSDGSQPVPQDNAEPLMLTAGEEAIETGLTLAETATAYGVSISTLRRLLAKDKRGNPPKLRGTKISIPTGREYRIIPADMEALGYTAKHTVGGLVVTTARANLEAELLAAKVRDLEGSLQVSTALLHAKTDEAKMLAEHLADLREVIAKFPQLTAPIPKRHWWRK